MQNHNLFGLFLATLVAPKLQEIEEDLRRIQAEAGSTITAAVMGFLTEGISPQTTFELEKELERLLREAGRQILEAVFNLENTRVYSTSRTIVS